MVFTPDELITTSAALGVVGISSSYYPSDPDCIPLPWRADGNIHTGLRVDCAACLNLLGTVQKEGFEQVGFLKQTDAALVELLARLKAGGKL